MSLTFTAEYLGENFLVEVTHDGELLFLDHDIAYDETIAALGGKESAAVRLLDRWNEEATYTIGRKFILTIDQITGLKSDWAKHIIEKSIKSGSGECGTDPKALELVLTGNITLAQISSRAAMEAGNSVLQGWSVIEDSENWKITYDLEKSWQLRRFIDVMEALERGEDWPPLEATP